MADVKMADVKIQQLYRGDALAVERENALLEAQVKELNIAKETLKLHVTLAEEEIARLTQILEDANIQAQKMVGNCKSDSTWAPFFLLIAKIWWWVRFIGTCILYTFASKKAAYEMCVRFTDEWMDKFYEAEDE